MLRIFGIEVSKRAIALSQVHNVVEIVAMVGWLKYTLAGSFGTGLVFLIAGLTLEHILALAAGKVA